MRWCLLVVLAACGRLGFDSSSHGWQLPGWHERVAIEISNPLPNAYDHLPVLLELDRQTFDYAHAAGDGHDLRFAAADGGEAPYEIESFDPQGKSYVWLDPGHVPASGTTELELYYGNLGAPVVSLQPWSAGYAGVFHLQLPIDSSPNANSFIDGGTTGIPGKIGGARHFTAANMQSITIGSTGFAFDPMPRSECAWVATDSIDIAFHYFVAYGTFTTSAGFFTGRRGTTFYCGGTGDDVMTNNVYTTTGIWHYACCTYDLTTASTYFDGVLLSSGARTWGLTPGGAYIGKHIDAMNPAYWDGGIDEVRISSVARTPEWIAGEYSTMTTAWATLEAAEVEP